MLLVVAEVVIIWLKLLILMTEKMPYAGDPELLREKLLSIPDHISNVHDYPDNQQYKCCPHSPLTGERKKAWLLPGSLVIIWVSSVITFNIDFQRL